MEAEYQIDNLVETARGTVGRIVAIRVEVLKEKGQPDYASISYKLMTGTGSKGFFVPALDIKRVLASS